MESIDSWRAWFSRAYHHLSCSSSCSSCQHSVTLDITIVNTLYLLVLFVLTHSNIIIFGSRAYTSSILPLQWSILHTNLLFNNILSIKPNNKEKSWMKISNAVWSASRINAAIYKAPTFDRQQVISFKARRKTHINCLYSLFRSNSNINIERE